METEAHYLNAHPTYAVPILKELRGFLMSFNFECTREGVLWTRYMKVCLIIRPLIVRTAPHELYFREVYNRVRQHIFQYFYFFAVPFFPVDLIVLTSSARGTALDRSAAPYPDRPASQTSYTGRPAPGSDAS